MYIEKNEDTIYAPATIPGTGAITIIRLSGHDALTIADRVVHTVRGAVGCEDCGENMETAFSGGSNCDGTLSKAPGYSLHFGQIFKEDGKLLDEVLVSVFRAPRSYTGENSVEISCHASSYIFNEISSLLVRAGARLAEPGEFTRRAFLNGKMDLAQAEAVADVIAAQNSAAHRVALNQMKGGFSSELQSMRAELLDIVSLMELELDFSEEDVEFADRVRLNVLIDEVLGHIGRLRNSFMAGNAIKNGIPVAIVGATNAGKSTLLNALLGEDRAIVSDVHGTTRDTIEETMNIDGLLFRFIDTAGLRETSDAIEKAGIERSMKKLHEARVILGVVDGSLPEEDIESSVAKILMQADTSTQKVFIVLNKSDLWVSDSDILSGNKNVIEHNKFVLSTDKQAYCLLSISASEETGIEVLKQQIAASQKDIISDSDTVLVTNLRHYEALSSASAALSRVKDGLADGIPTDLAAQDIREALNALGSILGEISTDEVLGNIFSHFCIGK